MTVSEHSRVLLLLLLCKMSPIGTRLARISEDQLIFTDVTVDAIGIATAQSDGKVQRTGNNDETRTDELADMPPDTRAPRGSLRATLKRIGVAPPAADDEQSLHDFLREALGKERMTLLRGLLFERGGRCAGCLERQEFVDAVMTSLRRPLEGRHALPLFLFDMPLFPHTEVHLNLYEPRYKLLCRKALKEERLFGFATGSTGTLARIKAWRFADDDAADGACHVTVAGVRRFKLGRQWQDKCAGCTTGPLHYSDVSYFNDTETRERRVAKGVALVKEALRLHDALVDTGAQRDLEEQIGATPTTRDQGYAMSFWLAAACARLDERCKTQAHELLASTSTAERAERVLRVQKALAGKKFTSSSR